MIVVLAGGVGGAKMAQGLQAALPPGDLTVVVNIADDFELYGLCISPDLDTVMYTLAGIADPVNGWGVGGRHTEYTRRHRPLRRGTVVPARGPGLRDAHLAHGAAAGRETALGSHDRACRRTWNSKPDRTDD